MKGCSGDFWQIIDRAVRGGESWYAAWQALKEEFKENWPTVAFYTGSGLLTVWTYVEGLALRLAIVVGLVVLAALYTIRAQYALLWHHQAGPVSSSLDADGPTRPVTHDELLKLAHALTRNTELVSELAESSRKSAVSEIETLLLRHVEPKIDNAERKLNDMSSRLDQDGRDLNVLLYHALYEMNLRTLRDLLDRAPTLGLYYEQKEITTEWLNEQCTMANEFVEQTIKALRYTPRFERLQSVFANAENEADHEVKQTPVDRRPKEVDPFDLRSYVIAVRRCEKVVSFLVQEEKELVGQTQAQRETIQERFSLKNP